MSEEPLRTLRPCRALPLAFRDPLLERLAPIVEQHNRLTAPRDVVARGRIQIRGAQAFARERRLCGQLRRDLLPRVPAHARA
jgi:hypothetical protein